MIRFIAGPAEGAALSLRRVPHFLRVVVDQAGTVDALDQLGDTIREGETAHVYVLAGKPSSAIVCSRGKGCRQELIAEYRQHDEQPPQAILRDNAEWQAWTHRTWEAIQEPTG